MADWKRRGEEVDLNTGSVHSQSTKAVALEGGGYILFWTQGGWSSDQVFAQWFDDDHNALGDPQQLTFTGYHGSIDVDVRSDGSFVLSWSGEGADGASDIFVQQFDSAGNATGGVTLANQQVAAQQDGSHIVALDAGGFAVMYFVSLGDQAAAGLRLFDASGNPVGNEQLFTSGPTDRLYVEDLQAAENGGFDAVILTQLNGADDGYKVSVFHFDSSGNKTGETAVLSTDSWNERLGRPGMIELADGTHVVYWVEDAPSGGKMLVAKHYDANWNPLSTPIRLDGAEAPAGFNADAQLVALDDGNFVVAYETASRDIAVREVDMTNGAFGLGDVLVTGSDQVIDTEVDIILTAGGDLVTIYSSNSEIHAQVLTPDVLNPITGTENNDFGLIGTEEGDDIQGFGGDDFIRAQGGDDLVDAGAGDDYVRGGTGDDVMDGGEGVDRIGFYTNPTRVTVDLALDGIQQDTGAGLDTLSGFENLSGTPHADTLFGSDGDNVILTSGGDDFVDGRGGDDLIMLGSGNVVAEGGAHLEGDTLSFFYAMNPGGGWTVAPVTYSLADDQGVQVAYTNGSVVATGFEHLSGSIGDDHLTGDGLANELAGDLGDDHLFGGEGGDILYGDARIAMLSDTGLSGERGIYWNDSGDTIAGQVAGDDWLYGEGGADTLYGGGGNDRLFGGTENDTMYGGTGDDLFIAWGEHGEGADYMDGGDGIDTVDYSGADQFIQIRAYDGATMAGAAAGDTLVGIENIIGTDYDDVIWAEFWPIADNEFWGGAGNDSMNGFGGNDRFHGEEGYDYVVLGGGDDYYDGGTGNDIVAYYWYDSGQGIRVDLRLEEQVDFGQGIDTLIDVEAVQGTQYDDVIHGDEVANYIWTGEDKGFGLNHDQVFTDEGDDLIDIGIGNHVVDGGADNDTLGIGDALLASGVTIDLSIKGVDQDWGHGTLNQTGIENVSGSLYDDHLIGDGEANILYGNDGVDTLEGGGGADTLYGDSRFSLVVTDSDLALEWQRIDDGVANTDYLYGGSGDDNLFGEGGDDFLYGEGDNDALFGGAGNDWLDGGDGNDWLVGGKGNNDIYGGSGLDTAAYGNADGPISVDMSAARQVTHASGTDYIHGDVEEIRGTRFGDDYLGTEAGETFWGGVTFGNSGANQDVVDMGGGNDLVRLGAGDHVAEGGSGDDALQFFDNFGGGNFPGFSYSLADQGAVASTGQGTILATGFENLGGGGGVDHLWGDDGNNVIAGHGDGDWLYGGIGNDTLHGDGVFIGAEGGGWTIDEAWDPGDDHLFGEDGDDTLHGGAGDDHLDGGADNDTLYGGDGNDWLIGGTGADLLHGGEGIDTADYSGETSGVLIRELWGQFGGAAAGDWFIEVENIVGTSFDDIIWGNTGDNEIWGGAGNDQLYGGWGGDDIIHGEEGNDFISASEGDDEFHGGAGFDLVEYRWLTWSGEGITINLGLEQQAANGQHGTDLLTGIEGVWATEFEDVLIGTEANELLAGGEANHSGASLGRNSDTIDAGGGNDLVWLGEGDHEAHGGSGDDFLLLADATQNSNGGLGFTFSLEGQGAVQVTGRGDILATGFENLAGSAEADVLTGTGEQNILLGGAGGDTIDGGGDNDVIHGDSSVWMDDTGFLITLGEAVEGVDYADTIYGGDGNDTIYGELGDDIIHTGDGVDYAYGGVGDDTFHAGTGEDRLYGEDGNDIFYGNAAQEAVRAYGGDGEDTFNGTDGTDLFFGQNDNDLLIGAGGNDYLAGQSGDDEVWGGAGNDLVRGDQGNDLLDGGSEGDGSGGFDVLAYHFDWADYVIDLEAGTATSSRGETDLISNFEDVWGSNGNDMILGDSGSNWFIGFGGDDEIHGRGGDDLFEVGTERRDFGGDGTLDNGNLTIIGGADNDTISFRQFNGVTFSLAILGAQLVGSGSVTASEVENLSGSIGNDVLYGDIFANVLAGDGGDDYIEGGAGDDTIHGDGAIYFDREFNVRTGEITVYDDAADMVSDNEAYAPAGASVAGNDELYGGDGNDTIFGGAGVDQLFGDGDVDTLHGGDDGDILHGGSEGDFLYGEAGDDELFGDAGDDFLDGGSGDDELTGGEGADNFFIGPDSGDDIILDFEAGTDEITFDASLGIGNMGDLLIEDGPDGAVISWGTDDSLTIAGVAAADVGGNYFGFEVALPDQAPPDAGPPAEPGPGNGNGGGGGGGGNGGGGGRPLAAQFEQDAGYYEGTSDADMMAGIEAMSAALVNG
ncbi:calcium-binding protein [Sphingomicrobium arenosum]|uniref:calcium-binding protein n=1 Tax=Sphingomicrobium arenosum TaxID=2233861 RepID=UPI00223F5DD3|nr:calcium-binding protein [Sphingomicrobium arenosum]